MPHLDGLAATRTILADPACRGHRVLVLTTFDDDDLVLEALRSGASGFLLKDTRPHQLLEAIEVVAAGEALLHPRVTRRLIERFAALPAGRDPAYDDGLTDREREVLLAVSQGLSNHEIASAAAPGLRHREDPRQPPADQARLPRPRPAGDVRLRVRARRPGWSLSPCSGARGSVATLSRDPTGGVPGQTRAGGLARRVWRHDIDPDTTPDITPTSRRHHPGHSPDSGAGRRAGFLVGNHAQGSPLREVLAFVSLTFALAVGLVLWIPDAHINVLLSALLPTVAVTVLTFTMFRRGQRRELWRGIGLGRAGTRTWGSAFGIPILLCGGAFGIALLVGAGHLRPLHITGFTVGNFLVNSVLNFLVMVVVLLGEEIGWRGFMLPRIQQLTTARRAALVTGFTHGCFHLPLILLATTYDTVGPRWIAAPLAVLTITAAGVFYAWLWDRSGSVWSVTIGHTFANMTFDWGFALVATTTPTSLALVAGETGIATFAVVAVMAVVLLRTATVWKRPSRH